MSGLVRGVKVKRVKGRNDTGTGERHLLEDQAAKDIVEGDQIRACTMARDLINQSLAEPGDE